MAEYPRLLKLDEDTQERLKAFLSSELENHYAERFKFIDNLEMWQKDYWAEPSVEVRTFPFKGAANIVVALGAISVEAVHARAMTNIFALGQFVSVEMRTNKFKPGTDPALERFLDFELLQTMRIRRTVDNIFLEMEKFGTGIGKAGYERIARTAVRTIGDEEQEFDVVVKEGSTIDGVSNARFLMPFQFQDPQTSPWCGEEHSMSPYELRNAIQSGLFYDDTWEKLEAWVNNANVPTDTGSGREFEQNQEDLEDKRPVFPERIDFVEVWCGFNVDRNPRGTQKEIQVFFHKDSNTLMGVRYNWKIDLSRPYRLEPFIAVEHRWSGIGILKQNEQVQREITTIHRQRLDNATLANMRMFKVHKLSGYGPNEPIFPGKMWFVDDMTHVEAMQLGDVYNSAFSNEQAVLLYGQQRMGVNELTLGMPQVGTPGTATGDLARIQEGNKKFDYSYANQKQLLTDLVLDTLVNIKQFGTKNVDYFTEIENGELVLEILNQPVDVLRRGLLFKVGIVGQNSNRLVDRNDWTQIAAMIEKYYVGMIQLAQAAGDPKIVQLILQKGLTAVTEAMRQILETYDTRNIDRIIVTELDSLLRGENANGAGGDGSQPILGTIGSGGSAGNGQPPGVDTISQIVAAATQRQ